MRIVFADTLYWVAIIKPDDQWHEPARKAKAAIAPCRIVTSDEILDEFLTALAAGGETLRTKAVDSVRAILGDPNVTVVPQSRDGFLRAVKLYVDRPDKSYSLTDCSSMNIMRSETIQDILTNDHHFQQEGYNVLIQK